MQNIIMLYGKGYVQIYAWLYWEKFLCGTPKVKYQQQTYSLSPKEDVRFQETVTVNLSYCFKLQAIKMAHLSIGNLRDLPL